LGDGNESVSVRDDWNGSLFSVGKVGISTQKLIKLRRKIRFTLIEQEQRVADPDTSGDVWQATHPLSLVRE
jgi:hypothetical protein